MNIKEIKEIFASLCEKNEWKLFKSKDYFPFSSQDKSYVLIDSKELINNRNHRYFKTASLNLREHLYLFTFTKSEINFLSTSQEIDFKTYCHFLPFLAEKDINIFNTEGKNNYKDWYFFFQDFEKIKTDFSDIKTFFQYHVKKFRNSEIPLFFEYMESKKFNNFQKNELLNFFCINHLKQINSNLSARNYLLDKIKDTLPEYKKEYQKLLFLEDTDELFVKLELKFDNIFISKQKLIRAFPLSFFDQDYKKDSSADISDYHNILTSLTTFLNKSKVKKSLNFNSVFLNAKQDTKPYYILTLEHSGNMIEEPIKNFLDNSFKHISEISQTIPTKNIFELKSRIKPDLITILNAVILEQKIPPKEEKTINNRKI